MSVKVSIYIVNHNYGSFVRKAIDSVLKQTYRNFELLIIDNESEDNSKEIIDKYYKNKKVKMIYQKNIGLNRTNNLALSRTDGKYIIRLDADDYFHEKAIEIMVNELEKNPKIGLVFSDYYLVDPKNNELGIFKRHNFEEVTLFNQPAHGACTMIKRECLEILNGYDEDFNCQDGWDLWLRFINKFGVKNINLPLFYYRQHDQNLTKNEDLLLETRSKMIRKVNNKKSDKTKKTIAIIPIRGHSVDTNSLGLRKLGNKLVIDWTIEAALNAKNITNVIITCPDRNLQKYLDQKYGRSVKFFHRNWKLALIHDGLDKTLTDLFNKLPKKMRNFDTICLLSIEYPFRKTYSIDMAIDALELFDTEAVLGVRQSEDLLFKHKGTGLIPLSQKKYIHHEEDNIYKSSGGIFVFKRGYYFKNINKFKKIGHIEVDEIGSLQISSNKSWQLAKILSKNIKSFE